MNPYSAEIDFRRQILTFKVGPRTVSAGIDFRRQILTSKVDPRTLRVKYV